MKASPAFTVRPARGVVPAGGRAEVVVEFRPAAMVTEEMAIEVTIAEFGARPMPCTIVGSAFPGLARKRALLSSGGSSGPPHDRARVISSSGSSGGSVDDLKLPDCQSSSSAGGAGLDASGGDRSVGGGHVSSGSSSSGCGGGKGSGGGGGARGDAYSRKQLDVRARVAARRDCRRDGPIRAYPPRPRPADALLWTAKGDEVAAGGALVPAALRGHGDVAYVLNQRAGKLRTKDVKVRFVWFCCESGWFGLGWGVESQ